MKTITKKDLICQISEKTGLKKVVAKELLQSFIDEIINELAKGNRLEFREFGVFEIKHRAPRRARNPRTGTSVEVPAKKVVHFKAGRMMKNRVMSIPLEGGPVSEPAKGDSAPPAGSDASWKPDSTNNP